MGLLILEFLCNPFLPLSSLITPQPFFLIFILIKATFLHCARIKLNSQMYVTEYFNNLEFVYFYQQTFHLIFFYNSDSVEQMYVFVSHIWFEF